MTIPSRSICGRLIRGRIRSEAVKKGIDLYDFDFLCYEYGKRKEKGKDSSGE